jgi:hypothetical protein
LYTICTHNARRNVTKLERNLENALKEFAKAGPRAYNGARLLNGQVAQMHPLAAKRQVRPSVRSCMIILIDDNEIAV